MEKDVLKRYMEAIYNRCFRMLKNHDQAWDAMQDVFASFYEAVKERKIQEPLFYLYRCSTNHCINLLRRQNRTLPLLQEPAMTNMEDGVQKTENLLMVDAVVQEFGQEAVDLLVYRHVDQMTFGEIGELVGMSDRGVKKKLDRLAVQVRQTFLQEQG